MGRHANEAARRRGVAPWVLITAAAVAVVVVATAVFLWAVNKPSTVTACTSTAVLSVVASTETAPAVTAAAAAFDATKPVARSACLTTTVTAADGSALVSGLSAGWKGRSTPAPALWVAGSVGDLTAMDTSAPSVVAGRSTTPVATTPVVLAVRASDAGAVSALSWSALATGGANGPTLRDGRTFAVGWPDPSTDEATAAGLQAVIAAADPNAGDGDPGEVAQASTILAALRDAGSSGVPGTTAAALAGLLAGPTGYTAVPATEAQVSKTAGLAAVYPAGRTVSFGVYPVPLTADWVDPTAAAGAALFRSFLTGSAGRQILADQGFRVPGVQPSASLSGVDTGQAVVPLTDAGPAVQSALAAAFATGSPATPSVTPTASSPTVVSSPPVTSTTRTSPTSPTPTSPAPATGAVVTIVVDTSAGMAVVDGAGSRLAAVRGALTAAVAANPGAAAGLWTVSTADGNNGFTQRVVTGPLSDKGRTLAVPSALTSTNPSGKCWLYGAIQTVYPDATTTLVPDRTNRVVVLTASSDSTPKLSRAALIAGVAGVANSGVQLDILGLSDDVNAAAMTQIAQAGHGTYTRVTAGTLTAALTALLRP